MLLNFSSLLFTMKFANDAGSFHGSNEFILAYL